MQASAFNLAVIGYICATGLALAYLIQREEIVHRLASLATMAAWALHTLGLISLAIRTGRPPLGTVPESVSTAVWVVVLVDLWVERRYDVKSLGAFVLPIVLILSLKTIARPSGLVQIGPTLG